ncbi:MAG TPA: hypothetical protein VGZ02_09510 [Candidatus Baltobacteraceae bacterium]|nr:hypothetical protein [Candidatus Baltobacteraceae bacterium]
MLQAIAALSFSITAIWYIPELSAKAPQILIQNVEYSQCADARSLADSDAGALGFAHAELACPQSRIANLVGTVSKTGLPAKTFLDYNDFDRLSATPRIETGFEVPEQVPFAAATSTIVAHVPVDDLFVVLRVDDILAAAFALEESGISRSDIVSTSRLDNLLVRVRPASEDAVRSIVKTVSGVQPHYDVVHYAEMGFIRDCNAAYQSLSLAALQDARRRALVMARAANVGLGSILGVVDAGGNVADAVCGTGAKPSMTDAARLAQPGITANDSERIDAAVPGTATVVRRLSAAWRLTLPPNGRGAYYRGLTDFAPRPSQRALSMTFVANGRQAVGDALVPDSLKPDAVTIQVSDDAYRALQHSPYANDLTYARGIMVSGVSPAVTLHSSNAAALKRSIESLRLYVSRERGGAQAVKNWWFAFASDNCHSSLDDALYAATQVAMARIGSNRLRYLEQTQATTFNVVCTTVPPIQEVGSSETWHSSGEPFAGFSTASVIVGY